MRGRNGKVDSANNFLRKEYMSQGFDLSWDARASRHLYETRDVMGDRRPEAVRIAHILHERLQDIPGFIGIDLYGSSVKGYADDSSDVDMRIIVDNSDIETSTADIATMIKERVEQYGKEATLSIQCSVSYVSQQMIQEVFQGDLEKKTLKIREVVPIFRKVTGKKIDGMRSVARDALSQIDPDKREKCIDIIATAIQVGDWDYSAYLDEDEKMEGRVGGERLPIVGEARKKMWKDRVAKILGWRDVENVL